MLLRSTAANVRRAAHSCIQPALQRRLQSAAVGARGDTYAVPLEAKQQFFEQGYTVLRNFITEEELKVRAIIVGGC